MRNTLFRQTLSIIFSLVLLLFCSAVYAENIDPNDDGSQYAYGENVGWLNAEPDGDGGPGVEVSDLELTGYIWGENIGWINLSPANYGGVSNDGVGNLSGYAWGENVGWISFSCENTSSCSTADYGVTIDPATGEFSGFAWGENIGWINFAQTTGGRVKTEWGGDDEGPITSLVMADPNPAPVNTYITLTAHVDDSETGGSTIASAEYSIDGSTTLPMDAEDGYFDGYSEDVYATVPLFTEAGVHDICVSGTDEADNTGQAECFYLAVYDPDGGFVTGGGWIMSPAGAYADDPSLTGKANFGFVSKYKKGATVPTGQTQFQFKVADLHFHSDTYDWLVVAGPKAMYKGTGTINGEGNYGFMLSAIDEELTPSTDVDMFRIKIWDKEDGDAVVYDNQMDDGDDADPTTAIGGGSIKIHKG